MARAFVIRAFGKKKDAAGKEIDFDRVHELLIGPALKAADLGGGTTGEIVEPGNIREDMFSLILEADVVVCDMTVHNANVFYELGIRHALRKRRTVLIKGKPTSDSPPFDLLTDRYLAYDVDDPAASIAQLREMIIAAMKSDRETDSPVFNLLPSLPEADPAKVTRLPVDFSEEVGRAKAAKSKGWLRLLAEEVQERRFHWDGLKLVAAAQWDLEDYEGSRDSWEVIRAAYPDDVDANLAVANLYERLYKRKREALLLEASDQAIERVLRNRSIARKQRAEALALKGRNQKTRWRLEWQGLATIEERRKAAMNRALIGAYEAYRDALYDDLNHFYPGLAAVQMGAILLELSHDPGWADAFDNDREADTFLKDLQEAVPALRTVVGVGVEADLRRLDRRDANRVWAEISAADVLFLADPKREKRVIDAYLGAIPLDKPFAWDAARGQLALFEELGVQAELARKVMTAIDTRFAERPSHAPAAPSAKLPLHLILFAGHRVDLPGRQQGRFPADREPLARSMFHDAVSELLSETYQAVALASAAPGADILAHEVCGELGVRSTICLPMPPDAFARLAFADLDDWRSRFLDLQKSRDVVVLANSESLPNWLHDSGKDSWERGNEWVMNMALSWGAERITLVALWDGNRTGDARGGTAHMITLAEKAGRVHIRRLDATTLVTVQRREESPTSDRQPVVEH